MYRLPDFNLTCNIYTAENFSVAPRLTSTCNLAWGRRVNVASTGGTFTLGVIAVTMTLLLPSGTDIRGPQCATIPDGVEVPAGSGRIYRVAFCDDIGKGFANEHRAATLVQVDGPWPVPMP